MKFKPIEDRRNRQLRREDQCESCVFSGLCFSYKYCKDYYLPDEWSDENIDKLISSNRASFLDEWWRYVDETFE